MILYLVIPCYNEEEVLMSTSKALKQKMNDLIKEKKIMKFYNNYVKIFSFYKN